VKKFFVSYCWEVGAKTHFSCSEITVPEINGIEKVAAISQGIATKRGLKKPVTILFFTPFDNDQPRILSLRG
jgi:hypothetical protein